MDKKLILASLQDIANQLDKSFLHEEANEITDIMVKIVTSQYTGKGSTMEYVDKRKQDYLASETERFLNRSQREKTTPEQRETYKFLINYAKDYLYDSNTKLSKEQRIRNMNDYMFEKFKSANLTPEQVKALRDQWDKVKKEFITPKREIVTLKPVTETEQLLDFMQSFDPKRMFRLNDLPKVNVIVDESNSSKPNEEKKAKLTAYLDRWVNKAQNIYKAWSSKSGSRSTRDTIGLVGDIVDYMQSMEDQINPAFKSMVSAKKSIVNSIMSNLASGTSMPTPAMPTPYSGVTGFPSKKPSLFGEGERLTGKKLKEQAKLETRGF